MDGTRTLDRFESRRSTVYGTGGVVATSQPLAAQAGLDALRNGGNAFDAAVTTAATLNVVEPHMTGIGGDVFALYRTADGDVGGLQSGGPSPEAATIERVRSRIAEERDVDPEQAEIESTSPHAVTVPGAVRGWEAILEPFGNLSLSDALQPAIDYALDGFPVSEVIATGWHRSVERLDETAADSYLLDGRAPRVGETMRLPNLGESFHTIARHGADAFYEGEIAEEIVHAVRSKGGLLTEDDLASFRPELVEPVSTTYRGAEVYELPPNNQGVIALEALNIAEALDAGAYPADSADRVHYLVEATKRAFVDGHHYVTDPDFETVPPLESKQYADRRAQGIGPTATERPTIGTPNADAENSDTVLLTVADGEGNVVSFINSLFAEFGSGIAAGETGILLQNRGRSFSLDEDDPNRLEPGKRPFHTLIPGLVRFDAQDWAAFGVMGGFMQPQGHVQLLSNLLDDGVDLQRACDRPRWRYREAGHVSVEPRMDDSIVANLVRRGHDVGVDTMEAFGGAQIARYHDGTLSAATEPRKDGVAIGF